MQNTFYLSDPARELVLEVRRLVDDWQDKPLMADLGTGSTRARLLGLASDMIRLLDSADDRGWDLRDITYQITVGPDDEEHDEERVDVILASAVKDDLDRQFDIALCKNAETDDVARPLYDGDQFVGGRPQGNSEREGSAGEGS